MRGCGRMYWSWFCFLFKRGNYTAYPEYLGLEKMRGPVRASVVRKSRAAIAILRHRQCRLFPSGDPSDLDLDVV